MARDHRCPLLLRPEREIHWAGFACSQCPGLCYVGEYAERGLNRDQSSGRMAPNARYNAPQIWRGSLPTTLLVIVAFEPRSVRSQGCNGDSDDVPSAGQHGLCRGRAGE